MLGRQRGTEALIGRTPIVRADQIQGPIVNPEKRPRTI
jgi:hypothetical protein